MAKQTMIILTMVGLVLGVSIALSGCVGPTLVLM